MENKLEILVWAISGGFAGTWIILGCMFRLICKLDDKLDKTNDRLIDVDKRLYRIEGIMGDRECALKHDHNKKAQ